MAESIVEQTVAHVVPPQRGQLGPAHAGHSGQPEGDLGRGVDRCGGGEDGVHVLERHRLAGLRPGRSGGERATPALLDAQPHRTA